MPRYGSALFFSLLGIGVASLSACGDTQEQPTGGGGPGGAGGGTTTAPSDAPTYYEDIAPILNKNCGTCHIENGIAPFSLLTYDDAKAVAGLMKVKTESREMPPWNPSNEGDCNTYKNARWLSEEEIALIAAWEEGGTREGDPKNAPPDPNLPTGLAKVDALFDTGVEYTPNDSLTDEYRCFVVDMGLSEDRFVTGYEVIPGDLRVVHHVIGFATETANADDAAAALDAADPDPGYLCYGGPGVPATQWTLGWAPGGGALMFPENTGLPVKAGRKMIVQVHYNLSNGTFPDRTTIKLTLENSVQKQAQILSVGTNDILLQPGLEDAPANGTMNVPAGAGKFSVWGVGPHMHSRGKTLRVEYEKDNQKTCIVDVQNWNFHWQGLALYETPLSSSGGGKLNIRCGYDTTKEMDVIKNGEGTDDEMCLNFLYVTK